MDSPLSDATLLAQRLVRFDTCNPPGREGDCAAFLRDLLQNAGFTVQAHAHAPGRTSLMARAGGAQATHSICFVGHLDTVPLGISPWEHDPLAGLIVNGCLHGRGSCDMKAGVAAFVTAAMAKASCLPADAAITLLLLAGEETGCEGAAHLATQPVALAGFAGVIVAEPTYNELMLGHKGALWLRAAAQGRTAHGATPEAGVNAIIKAVAMVKRLTVFGRELSGSHPVLGAPSMNIGTFHAGQNVNSVPDWAEIGIDLRTLPGMDHNALRERLTRLLQPELASLQVEVSLDSVYTDPAHPWVQRVQTLTERETGRGSGLRTASYFTDASALKRRLDGAPILILGPGHPAQMHQTDEFCELAQIDEAVRVYSSILEDLIVCARADSAIPAGEVV